MIHPLLFISLFVYYFAFIQKSLSLFPLQFREKSLTVPSAIPRKVSHCSLCNSSWGGGVHLLYYQE